MAPHPFLADEVAHILAGAAALQHERDDRGVAIRDLVEERTRR